jgi:Conserved TM helix
MTGVEIVGPSVQRFSTAFPSFLFALGILIVGYVIAKIAAGLVSRALGRTNLDARTAEALGLTKPDAPATVRSVVARIAFWLIMLFVLIGFFNQIGLPLVAEPLRGVADAIARVAPSALHAGLIFIVAWILAGLLRWLIVKTLIRLDVERRFGHFFVPEGTDPRGLAQTMGNLAFYLVLLLAVPPFLAALGQSALVAPLTEMLRILLSYLPNVAAAAVSIGLGWVVARILRQLVRNLLIGVGLDRAAERAGLVPPAGGVRPSALVATIVYFVVWIPFIIAGLDALKIEAISRPAIHALDTVLDWVPRGLGGAVLLILAWVVSRLVGNLVTQLLRGVGFDGLPARLGLTALQSPAGRTPSDLAGVVVQTLVLVFASVEIFEVIGLHRLAGFGERLVAFMINVVIATAIVGVGLWAGNVVQRLVEGPLARTGARHSQTIAALAKYAVVIFAFAMALQQIGFGETIVVWAFVLLFGAVCLALALAFGLGSREAAARAVDRALGDGVVLGSRPGSSSP